MKIVFFVEGESELIFLYNLLFHVCNPDNFSVECHRRHSGPLYTQHYLNHKGINSSIEILIYNVGQDGEVLTAIRNNAKKLFESGYDRIFGLRDLYCEPYEELSKKIDREIVKKRIRESVQNEIKQIQNNDRIELFFSVMEIEAWYFGFYKLFKSLGMPLNKVNKVLNCDISKIDAEIYFEKPKQELSVLTQQILKKTYNESSFASDISRLLTPEVIKDVLDSGKTSQFLYFYNVALKQLSSKIK